MAETRWGVGYSYRENNAKNPNILPNEAECVPLWAFKEVRFRTWKLREEGPVVDGVERELVKGFLWRFLIGGGGGWKVPSRTR